METRLNLSRQVLGLAVAVATGLCLQKVGFIWIAPLIKNFNQQIIAVGMVGTIQVVLAVAYIVHQRVRSGRMPVLMPAPEYLLLMAAYGVAMVGTIGCSFAAFRMASNEWAVNTYITAVVVLAPTAVLERFVLGNKDAKTAQWIAIMIACLFAIAAVVSTTPATLGDAWWAFLSLGVACFIAIGIGIQKRMQMIQRRTAATAWSLGFPLYSWGGVTMALIGFVFAVGSLITANTHPSTVEMPAPIYTNIHAWTIAFILAVANAAFWSTRQKGMRFTGATSFLYTYTPLYLGGMVLINVLFGKAVPATQVIVAVGYFATYPLYFNTIRIFGRRTRAADVLPETVSVH